MIAADACPGILDLHEARDGHVARIRLPGGYASARRLSALAALAARFGDGCVDLTARGNVQLRGIRPGAARELAQRAASAGLLPSPAHDRARNITASPLSGLAGHPDLRPLVLSLDRAIRAHPALAALPGRFLFCLDDGTGRAGLAAPQLRLIARMVRSGEAARLTAAGRVVLPLAGPVDAALARLAGAGLLVCDDHVLSAVTACSGMACASSLADVRSLATRVPGLAAVHWAGCSRRCGLPADATAVVATSAARFTSGDGAARHVLTVAARP